MPASSFIPATTMSFTTVEDDLQRLMSWCQALNSLPLRLDLSGVNHCDSAGLAFLIEAKRLARKHNTACIIDNIPDVVDALVRFCRLEHILTDNESN